MLAAYCVCQYGLYDTTLWILDHFRNLRLICPEQRCQVLLFCSILYCVFMKIPQKCCRIYENTVFYLGLLLHMCIAQWVKILFFHPKCFFFCPKNTAKHIARLASLPEAYAQESWIRSKVCHSSLQTTRPLTCTTTNHVITPASHVTPTAPASCCRTSARNSASAAQIVSPCWYHNYTLGKF